MVKQKVGKGSASKNFYDDRLVVRGVSSELHNALLNYATKERRNLSNMCVVILEDFISGKLRYNGGTAAR